MKKSIVLTAVFSFIQGVELLKHFAIKMLIISSLFFIVGGNPELYGQRLSRDLNVDLLVNQLGYTPQSGKIVVTEGKEEQNFEIIDLETQKVVYTGILQPKPGDFGEYLVGDFSTLTQEGYFYIKSDTLRSYPFQIFRTIYQSPMKLLVGYFSAQRCGSSTTGYLSPCHLDDGVRLDNGKHQDVTGGWHDACDLRKMVGNLIYGMIGLAKTYELEPEQNVEFKEMILEELMWGNIFFLKMQEPDGYVMSQIGYKIKEHSDNNRWTDNIIGEEGGELRYINPTAGRSTVKMTIFGNKDDRVINTNPIYTVGQYNFITSQALMARITKTENFNYSQKCLQAAIKCFEWTNKSYKETNPGIIGTAIQASIELYKTTNQDIYKDFAIGQVSLLKKLQASIKSDKIVEPGGFFYTSFSDQEPYKHSWFGSMELISLCELIQTFPMHKNVSIWKEMLLNYTSNYLLFMSQRNSFGIVPYGLFAEQDPGGNRKIGEYWYRYFQQRDVGWWSGINTNIASAGVGLVKAADILNNPELKKLAQRQLDWIIGSNPFNSSTLIGVGYNHPKHYGVNNNAFSPNTPPLPGAVMAGLGGDSSDKPIIGNGIWQISEYWTPMVAYTLWLMAETSNLKD